MPMTLLTFLVLTLLALLTLLHVATEVGEAFSRYVPPKMNGKRTYKHWILNVSAMHAPPHEYINKPAKEVLEGKSIN